MTDEQFEAACAQLKESFGNIATANGGGQEKFIRTSATLPRGCAPARTEVLVVINGDARPQIYAKPGIKLPNGRDPRSTSQVNIGGEAWLQFSYSFAFDPDEHTLAQFVAAALMRFKLAE